jgi:hypothetical protein
MPTRFGCGWHVIVRTYWWRNMVRIVSHSLLVKQHICRFPKRTCVSQSFQRQKCCHTFCQLQLKQVIPLVLFLPHLFTLVFCFRCECMKYCHSWTLNNQQSINYWSEINSEPEHWLSLSTWLNHICHCWLHWLSLSTWLNHICHCWLHWLSLSTWLNHICHCWLKQMKYPRYYNCSTEGNAKCPKLTCQHSQGSTMKLA